MTDKAMQIDWGATTTAEAVTAMRQSLAAGSRASFRQSATAAQRPTAAPPLSPAPVRAAGSARAHTVKLKKLRTLGGAAGLPGLYAIATACLVAIGVSGIWQTNNAFAPEMYGNGMVPVAKALSRGDNYAVFDLNINIRKWRDEQVKRFSATPDLVVLGASHWQEAHASLVKSETMYNGHVHRDYWEDLLANVEVYVRNKRMPKRMIIAIRDKQFTPVGERKDFLWEPGIPNYRAMAGRLGIETEPFWKTYPYQRAKERLSLSMLFTNVTRWFNAAERPHATRDRHFQSLDTLLPDGSIVWSADHRAFFTQDRSRSEALKFAESQRNAPPMVDPRGVDAFDKLLTFIERQGTQVILAHPPFNPIYYDAVKGSRYVEGLDQIRRITRDLAAKHHLRIIGDFDPAKVGCTSDQYIDAEHSSPACLQNIFNQYEALLPELRAEAGAVKP